MRRCILTMRTLSSVAILISSCKPPAGDKNVSNTSAILSPSQRNFYLPESALKDGSDHYLNFEGKTFELIAKKDTFLAVGEDSLMHCSIAPLLKTPSLV